MKRTKRLKEGGKGEELEKREGMREGELNWGKGKEDQKEEGKEQGSERRT